jgi:hypothetical protein
MTSPTAADLSIPEAAQILEPVLTTEQWRYLVRIAAAAGLRPVGRRHTGEAGRPFPTYPANVLIRLHGGVAPVLIWITKLIEAGELPDDSDLIDLIDLAATGTDTA